MHDKSGDNIAQLYDASVEAYDKLYRDIQSRKYSLILARFNTENILDVGIGTGYICGISKAYVVGIDISYKSLLYARRKGWVCDLVLGEASQLPIRRGFDLAVSLSTIHHIKEPYTFIIMLEELSKNVAISVMKKLEIKDDIEKFCLERGYKKFDLWDDILLVK